MQVISVVGEIVGLVVVWRALSLAIVVDNQVARQPHQPILQVALFRIILFQRSINSNEDFLSQILSSICSGSKSISQVIYSSRISVDNVFPGRAISRATLANQFGSFIGSQSPCSPHLMSPPTWLRRCHSHRVDFPLANGITICLRGKFPVKAREPKILKGRATPS